MKRALTIGLIGGIILSLAGLYPIMSLLAPLWLAGWERPFVSQQTHLIQIVGSTLLGVPVLLGLGLWAAHRAQARGWRQGARAGASAGGVAALIGTMTLILPTRALFAYSIINGKLFTPELMAQYVQAFSNLDYLVVGVPLVAILFWGLQGAVQGWRRRQNILPERPSLLNLLQDNQPLNKWFADDDTAVFPSLLAGSLVALLLAITIAGWFRLVVVQNWPELAGVLQQNQTNDLIEPLLAALPLLTAAAFIGLVGFGIVTVSQLKNPSSRWRARWTAVWQAALIIGGTITAVLLHYFYFHLGLASFWAVRLLTIAPDLAVGTTTALQVVENTFLEAAVLVTAVLVIPWLALLLSPLLSLLLASVQAILAILPLAALRHRPVDKATALRRRIRRQPDELLPMIYALFAQNAQAYDVLVHLAVQTQRGQPDVATLAAALHTLGMSQPSAEQETAVATIHNLLKAQRGWRWEADLRDIYQSLGEMLQARTLPEIAAILQPSAQRSAALPPLIVQNSRLLGRILDALHKVEQVADLPTRLIFLQNALTVIKEAQTATQTLAGQTPLPQQTAVNILLDRWQGLVLASLQRVQRQADVVLTLQTQQITFEAELPLLCQIENQGLSQAERIGVALLPGEGYYLLGIKSEGMIEKLLPNEQQDLTFWLVPEAGQSRLQVSFALHFTDGMNTERRQVFTDVVELIPPERPFLLVQPNPYTPNVPLKEGGLFVGRTDLVRFIQGKLASSEPNRLIVLQSQRRMGKTSLLYQLRAMLAETHFAVLIDLPTLSAQDNAAFLYAVAHEIVGTLVAAGIEATLPPRTEFTEAPELVFRTTFLQSWLPHLGSKNLLLLFDEFEELERRVEDGRLQPEIFLILQNLIQHESHIDFIFAGAHQLEALKPDYWAGLCNLTVHRPLNFLAAEEMHRLIIDPVSPFNIAYDPLAVERIIAVTAGHPYFAQLLLHEMMIYHNEMEASYLTTVDVDQVITRIVQRREAHFRFLWLESSEEEQWVLQAIVKIGDGAAVNTREMRRFLKERGHASSDRWGKALGSLESRDILVRQEAKNPLYRFKVELIRLWLDQMRPIT